MAFFFLGEIISLLNFWTINLLSFFFFECFISPFSYLYLRENKNNILNFLTFFYNFFLKKGHTQLIKI